MFSAAKTAGPSGYNISRSVRLRSSASAYLSRTPASTGNQRTLTWSGWVKRGTLATRNVFFDAFYGNNLRYNLVEFTAADTLRIYGGIYSTGASTTTSVELITTQVFRDPSAWYHILIAIDTTQVTSSDRVKVYVNGVQVTAFGTATYPAQNNQTYYNVTTSQMIMGYDSGQGLSFDGYLTEINFIDGQALTPSSFGSTNATTGVWQPAKYTGTYGTNGFYLNFSDNSAATAAAIGKDYSGNGNNWTPNNISVTAGVTYDSMIDVPTPYADGSTGRGNYAVINPLSTIAFPVTNGNLSIGASTTSNRCSKSSIAVSSGKWYWEFKASSMSASGQIAGICSVDALFSAGVVSSGYEVGYYSNNGNKYVNGTASAYGASWTTANTIGVALDVDGGTVTFYKDNVSQGSISITAGQAWVASWTGQNTTDAVDYTFGQRPFSYTPPTGFKALNTYNLPASTITNGGKYMAATTYTGNGTSQSVVNAGAFRPDLVWVKDRNAANNHILANTVAGITNFLNSNTTNAESSTAGLITAVNSNGFSVGSVANVNTNAEPYIGWQWQAGQGSTSSNTSGSITSTVSVSTTAGFSVATFTNVPSIAAAYTIGHGLNVAPKFIILKKRQANADAWYCYHEGLTNPATAYILLNTTAAQVTGSLLWQSTAPTSSVFTIRGSSFSLGTSDTFVAYCWAEIAGFSKFGSYTGNGSADGPFVYCGFRPRWILWKSAGTVQDWYLLDTSRDPYNQASLRLCPDLSNAELASSAAYVDFLSNGFKYRTADNAANASGVTYIYAAFAENPFQNSLAR